ncbi:MAG: DNA cytosine methyltransferase [Candidatus Eisenbacteria sp.]|nr:DNA cytosine methyltransferase [Candidatus Eisenbacteria bacterium]
MALCSGYDGFTLGLSLAILGYRTVCHVERETYASAMLVARMEDGTLPQAPIWSDIATFCGAGWRGAVDIITAGFPCQPWSCAGQQKGTEDDRWVWPDIARIIGEVEPGIVFLENVPGLIAGGLGPVLGSLASLGFDAEWGMFRASDVGAPHRRERLFILAHRDRDRLAQLREGWLHERKNPRGHDTDGCNTDVEHADGNGRGPRELPIAACAALTGAEGRGRAFPPGPDDYEGWRAALPATQPAICGVAHGPTNRVGELRACGNGVVPAVVALAFITLARRAME